jgi:hypothetical protein
MTTTPTAPHPKLAAAFDRWQALHAGRPDVVHLLASPTPGNGPSRYVTFEADAEICWDLPDDAPSPARSGLVDGLPAVGAAYDAADLDRLVAALAGVGRGCVVVGRDAEGETR